MYILKNCCNHAIDIIIVWYFISNPELCKNRKHRAPSYNYFHLITFSNKTHKNIKPNREAPSDMFFWLSLCFTKCGTMRSFGLQVRHHYEITCRREYPKLRQIVR